jgi:diaminopimelate epimerase
MKFTKMHGLGNDYVYVNAFEERVRDPAALSRAVSDRHTGIGSDGLILIAPSERANVRMEMYNADGSRGTMCGNGIRCVAKYSVEHRLAAGPELAIETDSGVKRVWCCMEGDRVASVRVDMGEPRLAAGDIPVRLTGERIVDQPVEIGGETYRMTCVSMGNPHAVVFVKDVARFDLHRIGPLFEHATIFPDRVNLHVVQVDRQDRITMRTWERGSGATRACGSGACAVCVACVLNDKTNRAIKATLPGGDLELDWLATDNHVYKTGPAVEVFTGEWLG